jgi:hypothetical protein
VALASVFIPGNFGRCSPCSPTRKVFSAWRREEVPLDACSKRFSDTALLEALNAALRVK